LRGPPNGKECENQPKFLQGKPVAESRRVLPGKLPLPAGSVRPIREGSFHPGQWVKTHAFANCRKIHLN
jgi:hypothetical protein